MGIRQWIGRVLAAPRLTYLNALLLSAAIYSNAQYQLFCRSVLWASIVLVIVSLPVIFYPLFKDQFTPNKVVFFLFGIAACICLYCIVFLHSANVLVLLLPLYVWFKPVTALAALPHFLLVQILFHVTRSPEKHMARKFAGYGAGLCVASALFMAIWFNRNYDAVQAAIDDPVRNTPFLSSNYMTERMLGMHFKYHTSLCLFDGWRPPLHDPFIVVASWLNFSFMQNASAEAFRKSLFIGYRASPFVSMGTTYLEKRVAAYKLVFPGKPLKEECSCAKRYSEVYLNHRLFK